MPMLILVFAMCLQTTDPAVEQAIKDFNATFSKRGAPAEDRISAIKKLGETRAKETAKVLARLLTMGDEAVAMEAGRALATFTEVKGTAALVAPALCERVNAQKTPVRVEIVKCLAALKDPAGLPAMHASLRDRDLMVAKEIVLALKAIRHKASIPVLIEYLKTVEKAPAGGSIEIPIEIPQTKDLEEYDLPRWNFTIVVTADEYARMRNQMLHEPMLDALRSVTNEKWYTWRGWSEWWTVSRDTFKVQEP